MDVGRLVPPHASELNVREAFGDWPLDGVDCGSPAISGVLSLKLKDTFSDC
jgi:hypothetical protein